jgi:molybdopterin converting factor small subunit
MSVTVKVQCLGMLRERASATPIALTDVSTAGEALAALAAAFEAIASLEGAVALATDEGYLQHDDPLHDGMQLLLVPPVSGG